jgi:activator of HSP90 ATPase
MKNQIEKTYIIDASIDLVWDALTLVDEIGAWGAGPAIMTARAGQPFSLWGGDIHGKNTEVVAPKLLKQDWYSGDWKKPSQVEFHLVGNDYQTKIKLVQNGVPPDEREEIAVGWDDYYIGAIKSYLES